MKTEARPESPKTAARKSSRSNDVPATRERPLRTLFMLLNQPEPSTYGRQRIVAHAEQSVRVIQLGLGAIGHLLAHSAVQVGEGTLPSECVESLGTLMAELSELSVLCHQLCAGPPPGAANPIVLQEGGGS